MNLPSTLQLDVQRGEGLHSDQVVHHASGVRVVGAVVKPVDGARRVLETFIPDGTFICLPTNSCICFL